MNPRVIAGRYTLVLQIGSGAMGQIWEAFDQTLQRKVALKFMSAGHVESETSRARFEQEARAIAKLQSPYVVQVFDAGIEDNNPYIIMELLIGEDFESRLTRLHRLPISGLVPMVDQMARALTSAHARNIVHRDLKPANIFLARGGPTEETVKILDFGVAAMLAGTDESDTGHQLMMDDIVGTPFYMSPEQIRGAEPDHRSDLWSLAVVVYRALTSVHPFPGKNIGLLMAQICADPFHLPSKLVPGLPSAVDGFFEKALAKDPSKRFQTASEFSSAFGALAHVKERGPAKILVVDDEPFVEKLMKLQFRKKIQQSIYEFIFAHDGESALEQLRKHPDIDMVLSDINMPKMDGLTFLSHVGSVNPFVRTVIVSAYSDTRNLRTAMNRGAFDFLVKPIDFEDLEVTIEKTLRLTVELRKNARSTEENTLLRMFLSPNLVHKVKTRSALRGLDRQIGTVVFIGLFESDVLLQGKTTDELLRTLNANFEVIVPHIGHHGGVVHKFFGPAILAIFEGEQHAIRAFRACFEIMAQLERLTLRTGEHSPFALGASIGLATGEILMGEIGSQTFERLDFAMLGGARATAVALQAVAQKNQLLATGDAIAAAEATVLSRPWIARPGQTLTDVFEVFGRAMPDNAIPSTEAAADTIKA